MLSLATYHTMDGNHDRFAFAGPHKRPTQTDEERNRGTGEGKERTNSRNG